MVDPRDRRTALPAAQVAVKIGEGASGYFSTPAGDLDPRLFEVGTDHLRPDVRTWALSMLKMFWSQRLRGAEEWAQVFFAGSGITYQWSAQRDPGDLDTLIQVDFSTFRRFNPSYAGWADTEVATELNDQFQTGLNPETAHWNGFEVTWYVNPQTIGTINPYAAYNVSTDTWKVHPIDLPADWDPTVDFPTDYWAAVESEHAYAANLVTSYNTANTTGGVNAPFMARRAAQSAKALFDDIHTARHIAFSRSGGGYKDFYNFRWQAHKKSGVITALRTLAATLDNPDAPMSADAALRLAVRTVSSHGQD